MKNCVQLALLTLVIGLLSGCLEGRDNTAQLCKKNRTLGCEQLNINDGQCRIPRTNLIWHRYQNQGSTQIQAQIEEYHLLEELEQCLELATQIQFLKQSDLKRARFDTLMYSIQEKQRLAEQFKQDNSPTALYFLWSQLGDRQARRQFLQLEGHPELNNAQMQYALATFYIQRDKEKALAQLLLALELSQFNTLNLEIIKALSTLNQSLGKTQQAYVWAMVAKNFDVPVASQKDLQLLYGFDPATTKQLDQAAQLWTKAIKKNEFSQQMISENLE